MILFYRNVFAFLVFSYVSVMVTLGFSASSFRSLDSGRRAVDEEISADNQPTRKSHLDTWLNRTPNENTKSCCTRLPKKFFVGNGLDGEIYVDMGQCRQSCTSKKTKINRKEFDAILKANHSVDPVELYLAMQRDVSSKSCGEDSHCLPTRTVVERHMTMAGVQEVAVIEECSCVSDPELCHRIEERVTHFPGTPFEIPVDVGRCSGPCNTDEGLNCRSIRNTTIAIAGPNGDTCVEVIDKCSCAPSCYRASSMEHIYDYTLPLNDEAVDSPAIKVVDVGKCVGECNTLHHKQHCVLRDTNDSSKCLMSLTRRENNCAPLGFQVHRYKTRNGTDKNLLSITECGCQ